MKITNLTDNGKCTGCGECCSNTLPMTQQEINKIHHYIKKHHIKEQKHVVIPAVAIVNACPFLDTSKPNNKCMIYDVRPKICQKFICDKKQLPEWTAEELKEDRRIIDVKKEFYK